MQLAYPDKISAALGSRIFFADVDEGFMLKSTWAHDILAARKEAGTLSAIKRIGFIGTGIMGSAMAGHLMDAGFEVSVYNRTKSKAQPLIDRGAHWCSTAGECARDQDAVITIVGYPKDVEQIYLGAGGILDSARSGAYVIDMTTSSPILAEKIFEAAKARGIHAVDSELATQP